MIVLESEIVPASTRPRLWIDDSQGYRMLIKDGVGCIASDGPGDLALYAQWLLKIRSTFESGVAAHVGGGFCRLAAMMGNDFQHTVYDTEPSLRQFADEIGATFVPGDYRATIRGMFDVIIYDLVGDVPRDFLSRFLNPGGIILPLV